MFVCMCTYVYVCVCVCEIETRSAANIVPAASLNVDVFLLLNARLLLNDVLKSEEEGKESLSVLNIRERERRIHRT